MNSRERVLSALNHQPVDRCPVYAWFDEDIASLLAQQLGAGDWEALLMALKVDRFTDVSLDCSFSDAHCERARSFVPAAYHGRTDVIICDDGRVIPRDDERAMMGEVMHHPLGGELLLTRVEDYPFPCADDLTEPEGLAEFVKTSAESGTVTQAALQNPLHLVASLRGAEQMEEDARHRTELLDYLFERAYEFVIAQAAVLAERGVDMIQIVGDVADEDGLFLPFDHVQAVEFPLLRRLCQVVANHNPETKVGLYTSGNCWDILPGLIDAGVAYIGSLDCEAMNPTIVKQRFGADLVLHGCMDAYGELLHGSPKKIRKQTRRLIDRCGADGGLILGPSSILHGDHPVENILAFYQALD